MTIYAGCDIPEDVYFHPERDCWVRFEADGIATMGMTDIAQTLAGKLIYIKFKSVGKKVKSGSAAATIESAKWVGPFVMPFEAEIVEVNEAAFQKDILIANKDPYGEAWLMKVKIDDPEAAKMQMLIGDKAVDFFTDRIVEEGISCFRCVD